MLKTALRITLTSFLIIVSGCSMVKATGTLPDGTTAQFTAYRLFSDGNLSYSKNADGQPELTYGNANRMDNVMTGAFEKMLAAFLATRGLTGAP